MEKIKEKLKQLIGQIDEVTAMLYQQDIEGGYKKLDDVLHDFVDIEDAIFDYKQKNKMDVGNTDKIVQILNEALIAMENEDYVLLADILSYDILDGLEIDYRMLEENIGNE